MLVTHAIIELERVLHLDHFAYNTWWLLIIYVAPDHELFDSRVRFGILAYYFSEGFIALSSLVSKLVSEQLEVGDFSTTEEYITTLNAKNH